MAERFSNVIGFDDGPFSKDDPDPDVTVVGTVYAGRRFDGALIGRVTRDGDDATERLARLVEASRFRRHLQLVMLEGIALGGFNVVDLPRLHRRLGLPVLVVCRRRPDLDAIRRALLGHVPGGDDKWRLIQAAGPMEPLAGPQVNDKDGEPALWIQRQGLDPEQAASVVDGFAVHGHVPEPLRVAHFLARAVVTGESRGRV